jgi:hypothetical protein
MRNCRARDNGPQPGLRFSIDLPKDFATTSAIFLGELATFESNEHPAATFTVVMRATIGNDKVMNSFGIRVKTRGLVDMAVGDYGCTTIDESQVAVSWQLLLGE